MKKKSLLGLKSAKTFLWPHIPPKCLTLRENKAQTVGDFLSAVCKTDNQANGAKGKVN
ncbi:hypothetical protein [Shewanella colwelliana]|uniref:hypothetical protein n=1 Tax=Shewanella colwelliana TaxID=23 RepID=UPI0022AF3750|nr:hypothetical protein [Shewanella colwelliana]MCZ4339071.1 hypothetical protein [Shewanella colwelliana]